MSVFALNQLGGPGAILAELNFAWAPLEHTLSGNVGTGGLGFMAGYAFLFGGL